MIRDRRRDLPAFYPRATAAVVAGPSAQTLQQRARIHLAYLISPSSRGGGGEAV